MKKGVLAFIFSLILFMAAVGFGRNLQAAEQALSRPIETVQTAITAPSDRGGDSSLYYQISQRLTTGILLSSSYTAMETNRSAVAASGMSRALGIGSVRQSAC